MAIAYTSGSGFDLGHVDLAGGSGPNDLAVGGPGTFRLDVASGRDQLIVDNGGRANLNETAPWLEVGVFYVSAVNADGVSVAGTPWVPGSLAGAKVTVGAKAFVVADNTASALELTGSLAGVAIGDPLRGERDARGELAIRGASRVALLDKAAALALAIDGGAVLTHPAAITTLPESGLWLVISDGATIGADGAIDLSGRGYPGECGAGSPACGAGSYSLLGRVGARQLAGGSHGGLGGGGSPGFVYGNPLAPDTLGGGGGYGSGAGEPGGRGGGRVRLDAAALVIDGAVLARGVPGLAQAQQNGSGGAGGSIWLSAQTLGGSGDVDASGGAAGPGIGGAGGGGGRVAITWESDAASAFDSDAIDAHGGAADTSFGGPGTIFLAPPAGVQRLIVDNADLVNPNEIAPWPEVGLRTVSSAQSDRVTVTNAGWIPGAYVGLDAVLGSGATRYTIVSNTEDTLVFQAADGNVSGFGGAALRAYFVLEGALEVHGGSRVGLVDRLAATSLLIDGGAVVTHPPTVANAPEHGVWIEDERRAHDRRRRPHRRLGARLPGRLPDRRRGLRQRRDVVRERRRRLEAERGRIIRRARRRSEPEPALRRRAAHLDRGRGRRLRQRRWRTRRRGRGARAPHRRRPRARGQRARRRRRRQRRQRGRRRRRRHLDHRQPGHRRGRDRGSRR